VSGVFNPPVPDEIGAGADRRYSQRSRDTALIRPVNLSHESLSAPGQGLDVTRLVGRITQRLAQPVDRRVDAVLELDNRVVRPEEFLKFAPAHQPAWTLQQQTEDLKRLLLQTDAEAALAQFPRFSDTCC
jgi:hypothetical protein